MRHAYLWTALAIAILVTGIMLFHSGLSYYPVVRSEIPGGITLTFIDQPWSNEPDCTGKGSQAATQIASLCKECKVSSACPQQIDTELDNAIHDRPISKPVVRTASQRILIQAPGESALIICKSMTEQIVQQKHQAASCVQP